VFWITGALGFVWLAFWWLFYDLPARQKRLSEAELELITDGQESNKVQSANTRIKWRKLFSFPQTWALITGKGLIDPIFWFFLFWLPSYFSSTFSLDLKKPSLQLMIIYLAATIGSIGGGYISSWLIKKGWPILKARKASLLAFACLELSIMLTQFAPNAWMAVLLISLAIAVHQAWATNIFTMASDMFPSEAVSSVVGIAGTAGSIGGVLFPILIGYLLDTYKALGNVTIGYNIIFTLCSFAYLLSLTIIHFLTRKSEPVALKQIQ
ncbi:MAG: MFS transporter, partial [Bacteroidia bacterium]|nr:MFS transporter [Bacteroidia bacterium]